MCKGSPESAAETGTCVMDPVGVRGRDRVGQVDDRQAEGVIDDGTDILNLKNSP